MKIALISYEYPPDTGIGGISTYINQISKLLTTRGHYIEIFTASNYRTTTYSNENILVHRLKVDDQEEFSHLVGETFKQRHSVIQFDVVECAEIRAESRSIIKLIPDIPLVVKLHTPRFMCEQLGYIEPSLEMKFRRFIGALRQFKKPKPFSTVSYDWKNDIERLCTLEADEITTPSISLGEKLVDLWELPREKLVHLPNPYIPSSELLHIPLETQTNVVSFLGRLEIRKGIIDLVEAIPMIVRQFPNVKFRLVGLSSSSPDFRLNMQQYINKRLRNYIHLLEFTGAVPLNDIPRMLSITDICVFPSRWENFPNVCLEAMAAGRGIVGSNAGGMADMLDSGNVGLLVPPYSPPKIAKAVIRLLQNPELRITLGKAARDRVLCEYNLEKIGGLQEESYIRAIARRKALGKRVTNNAV